MNGGDRVFVDTNVLLYAVDFRLPEKRKPSLAWLEGLWSSGCGRVSWQVLTEFYSNSIRKIEVSKEEARGIVGTYRAWDPAPVTGGVLDRAWFWCDRAQVNFWDALILAAAEQTGCQWLLSEDFQAGQRFGDLTVVSPFLSSPAEFGLF